MNNPTLYRKRLIPDECVKLKDDIIIHMDEDVIVTKWNALKPKKDLHHGYSCYFIKKGFKVSKFYTEDNSLLYWYCDIVDYDFNNENNEITVTDLLADVIIYPNGFVKVVDINELAECLDSSKLSIDLLKASLLRLDNLLNIIYKNEFDKLTDHIERFETE